MNPGRTQYDPNTEGRPTPVSFLKLVEDSRRGRLKIYIGHAAGTGKTVQMLREGNALLARGHHVVAAFIETHQRPGTVREVGALPVLPRLQINYNGTQLEELDIDSVLELKPEIALIDELPHTNVPGHSRNAKRWQDIQDLQDAGISVITAMNIQHLESLGPVIKKLTGITVSETVPDSFLASADQIVNVDITPTDLRERMRRGEIYPSSRVETALSNFFTSDNLGNLRELALRELVRILDQSRPGSTLTDQTTESDHGNSPLAETFTDPVVMVAISSRPPDIRNLLRKASAIARRLNTHWYLVYVERPNESNLAIDAGTQRILLNNISMAKDLGATVFRLKGADVASTLAQFALEYGITHAIFGSPGQPRGWQKLLRLLKPDIITKFHELAPKIDLQISGES